MQSSRYRLYGPGACLEVAESILQGLPVCPSPHVWHAGVAGFLYDLATLGALRRAAHAWLADRRTS